MESSLPILLLSGAGVLSSVLFALGAVLERRRAEQRSRAAEQALEARSRYLGLLAQEMQGHGLALLGYATAPRAPAGRDAGLEGRARALMGLSADVSDLLAQGAGPRVLKEDAIPLGPVLDEVIGHIVQALTPGRRHWQVAPELRDLTLSADRRALTGALRQVLTRVVRQTRDGDSVQMRLVRADESVAIVVEDDGAGHAAEDMNGLTLGRGTRGLGLGLVVAHDLMRAHGGNLTIEAVPGIGARAWLTLPRSRVLEPLAA
ncbi:sensor histidine kinase [Pseudoroseomonas wenyumeiae]|uniref:histidine kinase n=1 Tax=Teichococcus wenyumeiae TaxID=2478470 RepID=A0A3A9JLI4_9PROT|nr:ATP-binding protein [Pseudoroseomonas wenyumeiae]RKK04574.1 sensor histidine kinase [Pseudoroseomonas wenyumeiae]RMI20870.1 sensor histidine kinase [Pseudoroseomonas wenyumeiae]